MGYSSTEKPERECTLKAPCHLISFARLSQMCMIVEVIDVAVDDDGLMKVWNMV